MTYISMMQAVRQTIEPLLIEQGFVLREAQTSDELESLKYERESDGSLATFHDDRHMAIHLGETRLFIDVKSEGAYLKTLKELLPNYLSLSLRENDSWTYRSQEELAVCIEEIKQIIKGPLAEWLKGPISNPAKAPMPKLTPDILKALIKSSRYSAEEARREGRLEDLARREQSIEAMTKRLDEMLEAGDDSSEA
jgi:hypothetical protein